MLFLKNKKIFLIFVAFLIGLPFFACLPINKILADAGANGTIDSTYKYAWSDKIGWINFAPTGADGKYEGLVINNYYVTGHAWSSKYGWINFGPFLNNDQGEVTNTSTGLLDNSAWTSNLGWINFNGVVINSDGQFTGTAHGDLAGTINFDLTKCTKCGVKTDWRPSGEGIHTVDNVGNTNSGGAMPQAPALSHTIIPSAPNIGPQKPIKTISSAKNNLQLNPSKLSENNKGDNLTKLKNKFVSQWAIIQKIQSWFAKEIKSFWSFIANIRFKY